MAERSAAEMELLSVAEKAENLAEQMADVTARNSVDKRDAC